jgi:hypothetical protein
VLLAAPDTEHGDHLGDDGKVASRNVVDPPEFFRFVRAPADQHLREKWGIEVDGTTGELVTPINPDAKPARQDEVLLTMPTMLADSVEPPKPSDAPTAIHPAVTAPLPESKP